MPRPELFKVTARCRQDIPDVVRGLEFKDEGFRRLLIWASEASSLLVGLRMLFGQGCGTMNLEP